MSGKEATEKLKRKEYEKELHKLQVELCYLQDWIKESGERAIIVLEGRDAAGKGGTMCRLGSEMSAVGGRPDVPRTSRNRRV
jgi:polyphosphate kinase 2 (PPK2 family)